MSHECSCTTSAGKTSWWCSEEQGGAGPVCRCDERTYHRVHVSALPQGLRISIIRTLIMAWISHTADTDLLTTCVRSRGCREQSLDAFGDASDHFEFEVRRPRHQPDGVHHIGCNESTRAQRVFH